MAIEKVINIRVNDGELDGLQQELNQVAAGFDKVDSEAKKADKSVDDVASNGGAIAILDQLTGGLATRLRDAYEASKLFNVSLKATRGALIATGIGAFVVAVGLLVEYWDDIVNFVNQTNEKLQRQIDLKNDLVDILNHELELLDLQEESLKLQGKSTVEIQEKRKEILETLIQENEAQLELLKTQQKRELSQAAELTLWQKIQVATGNAVAAAEGIISEEELERLDELREGIQATEKSIAQLRVNLLKANNPEEEAGTPRTQREQVSTVSELSPEQLVELDTLIQFEDAKTRIYEESAEVRKFIADEEAAYKRTLLMAEADLLGQFGGLLQQLDEDNKGLAIAGIIAQQVASTAKIIMATTEANAKAVAVSPLTAGQPWVTLNTISAGLGIASGVAAATKAISQLGGGGSPSREGFQAQGQSAPSFNVVGTSGVNQLAQSLNQDQNPIQAYVVGSNVTTQQALDRNIIETATVSGG